MRLIALLLLAVVDARSAERAAVPNVHAGPEASMRAAAVPSLETPLSTPQSAAPVGGAPEASAPADAAALAPAAPASAASAGAAAAADAAAGGPRAQSVEPAALPPSSIPATISPQAAFAAASADAVDGYFKAAKLDAHLDAFFDGIMERGRNRRFTLGDGTTVRVVPWGSRTRGLALERDGYTVSVTREGEGAAARYSLTTTNSKGRSPRSASPSLRGHELLALTVDAARNEGKRFAQIEAVSAGVEARYQWAFAAAVRAARPAQRYAKLAQASGAVVVDASEVETQLRRMADLWNFRSGLNGLPAGRWLVVKEGPYAYVVSMEALSRGELLLYGRSMTYSGKPLRLRVSANNQVLEAPANGSHQAHRFLDAFASAIIR